MKKRIDLTLPAVMELSGMMGETDGRNILMHVRSASVGEIFEEGQATANDERRVIPFTYENRYGIVEKMVVVMHFVAADDNPEDWGDEKDLAAEEIINYYKKYCTWEDENIERDKRNEELGFMN